MKKRLLFLMLAMIGFASPAWSQVEVKVWIDEIYYRLNNDSQTGYYHTATVCQPNSWEGHNYPFAHIPASVYYQGVNYPVISIERDAFVNRTDLTSVTIGENVTRVFPQAFDGCDHITTVNINATNLEQMYGGSVYIPHSVFYDSRATLTTVNFGAGVTKIPDNAFRDCENIGSFIIPASVSSIGIFAFAGCDALNYIQIQATTPPDVAINSFDEPSSISLAVPQTALSIYQNHSIWGEFNVVYVGNPVMPEAVYVWIDEIYYLLNNDSQNGYYHTASVIQPSSWDGHRYPFASIPASVNYQGVNYPVVAIHNNAFFNRTDLTSVTIGENVTRIFPFAFDGCDHIATVNFYATNMEQMYGNSVYIPRSVFYDSRSVLTTLNFGTGVTKIPDNAFRYCENIGSFSLPSAVTQIGQFAFSGCNALNRLGIKATTPPSVMGNSFDNPSSIYVYVPQSAISAYQNHSIWGQFVIRDEENPAWLQPYVWIDGIYYFLNNDSHTGYYHTASVVRPSSWEGYGHSYAIIPASVNYYGVTYPVVAIDNYAFANRTDLTLVTIGENVTCISPLAFNGCDHITTVDFCATNMEQMYGGSVYIPHSVFYDSRTTLTTLSFCSGVTKIPDNAFRDCENIGSFIIPASVSSIGTFAFAGCDALNYIQIQATTPPNVAINSFDDPSSISLNVPQSAVSAYRNHSIWGDFNIWDGNSPVAYSYQNTTLYYLLDDNHSTATVVFPTFPIGYMTGHWNGYTKPTGQVIIPNFISHEGNNYIVNKIGDQAFYDCTDITAITIGNNITTVADNAFEGCNHIATVNFYALYCSSLKRVVSENDYQSVFYDSRETLTTLNIGGVVTNIPDYAFKSCSHITSLTIPTSVTSIGSYAFSGCSGLTGTLTIPTWVTSIGNDAFSGCVGLTDALNLTSVTSLGSSAFHGCSGLTSVNVNVSVIPSEAFYGCTGLTTVTIGTNVTTVIGDAFKNCNHIATVNFNATNCTRMMRDETETVGTVYPQTVHHYYSVFKESTSTLTTLNIGSSVTKIPERAFESCNHINTLNIPSAVTKINNNAFKNCSGLELIEVDRTTPPAVYANTFDYSTSILLRVPEASTNLYRNHEYWGQFMIASNLMVAGVSVTEDNANNITGAGISGSVSYSFDHQKLTLNNATINCSNLNAIAHWIQNFKIDLVGANTITVTDADALSLQAYTIIQGSGSLNVTSNRNAIYAEHTLSIYDGCTVTATGGTGSDYCSVHGKDDNNLRIRGSMLVATQGGSTYGSIGGFSGVIKMNGTVDVLSPLDATWNATNHRYENASGNTITGQIVIGNPNLDLWVKGTHVSRTNAADILGDGKVSYDAVTNTLTLNGAYIYSSEHEGIRNGIDGLKINLEGNSQITSTVAEGILSEQNAALTIQGSGNLVVKGTTGIGVNKSLTITGGCRVDAESSGRFANSAIEGYMSNSTFTVNASTVIARSDRTIQGTIYGFGTFSCTGNAGITYPTGAHWCSTHHRIEDSDDVMLTGAVTISSATYNLYVKDIQVTDGNRDDVLGDGGSVSYNPSSYTLTLNNANITNTGTNKDGIRNSINGLKINLVGSNTITAGRYGVEMEAVNTTFTGNGSLNINAQYGLCLFSSSGYSLTLSVGCHLDIEASFYGILCSDGTLAIDRAEVRVKGGSNYATITCNALNLTEVSIMSPEGATFSNGYVRDANNNIIAGDYVVIGAQPYDLYVKGVQVSPVNRDDILSDGHASYDPGNNTLTLNNLTVSNISTYGIRNLIAGLTIKLIGTNSINASNSGIYSDKDFTIEGSYTDVLNVSGSDGIYANSCNLTIRGGCNVTATGKTNSTSYSGIYGSSSKTFRIINSSVTAQKQAPSSGSIVGYPISGFQPQITGCTISPTGMSWSNGHYVDGNGTAVTDPIVIAPIDYYIDVAGIRVTSANCNDVFADSTRFHPATVSYDPASDILTLNDARISTSAYGIINARPGLKINVIGYCSITSSGAMGIYTNKFLVIQGTGELRVQGITGIRADNCDLTIKDIPEIEVYGTGGSGYGCIYGYSGYSLTINRSHLIARSGNNLSYSAIYGFSNLNFTDNKVQFIQPSDGTYSSRSVYSGGSVYKGEVEIDGLPYGFKIDGMEVTTANCENFTYGVESGTISYDNTNHTLTLDNAVFGPTTLGDDAIENYDLEIFRIQLIGDNLITHCGEGKAINTFALEQGDGTTFTIMGPGTLVCEGDMEVRGEGEGHDQGQCVFSIVDDADVCMANNATIYSYANSSLIDLEVANSTLRAYQITGLKGFNDLPSSNAYVDAPDGADFSYSVGNGSIALNGAVAEDVVIITDYQLCVAGVWVTSLNAHDIRSEHLTSGTASYDVASHTLTLNNVNVVMEDDDNELGNGICSKRDFNIELIGENSIASVNNDGIYCWDGLHILGPGSLSVQGINGIRQHTFASHDFELSGACSVNVVSTGSGDCAALKGNNRALLISSGCHLFAQNSSLSNYSPIYGFNDLQLVGVEILQPLGAVYSTSHERIEDQQGNQLNAPVEIGNAEYDLWICGEQVTSANVNSLSSLAGVSGNVSFNHSTNTLTLDNATLNSDDFPIVSQIDGLTIYLSGSNRIEAEMGSGLSITNANTTITGGGSMNFAVGQYSIVATDMGGKLLTIEDECEVNNMFQTSVGGISTDGMLRINNAYVYMYGDYPIIANDLMLDYVEITSPAGGWFDATSHQIKDAQGNVATGQVSIEAIWYDLYVADIPAMASNADDILGDGTVSYDAASNTLTLNGATITNEGGSGIETYIENLNIFLVGGNTISSEEDGISLYADATISGTGNLTINAEYGVHGYEDWQNILPSLILTGGCQVNVNANDEGISLCRYDSDNWEGGVLMVDRSTLALTMDENYYSTTIQCRDLVLNGAEVTVPTGYYFNSGHHLMDSDGSVPLHVVIEPIRYDLWVAGIQVSPANAAHITGEGISGTVSYDAATNTLTLDNAFIENSPDGGDGYGIVSEIDGLTISLRGENGISSNEDGISLYNVNTSITGGGMLSIYSPYGIYGYSGANNVTLTISNESTVSLDCSSQGIYLNSMALCIDRSTVEVFGDANCGVYASNGWQLIDVEITSPYEAYWNGHYVLDAEGQVVGGGIVIEPIRYELYLADTQVTALNVADVLGEGISGTVSYDATTNTLTLNEATITNEGGGGIETYIDNLNIVLVGTNTIQTIDGEGIKLFADATISGTGSLAIEAWYGIYGYITDGSVFPSLTLEGGCQVNVDAIEVGINIFWDLESTGGVLTVDNSTLEVTKDENSYFATTVQCRDLVLNGVEVTDPEAYHFDEYYELVGSDDQVPNRVLIEPYNVFTGTVSGDWNNPSNWSKGELPLATSKVHVAAQCVMDEDAEVKRIVIEEMGSMNLINGAVLTVETITNSDASRFVITNGQLYCDNEVSGTFHKTVTIADADENGWNAIAVPMNSPSIANLTANTYDIYTYDEDADQNEWQNYKDSPFSFVPGQGYLYANSDFTDLVMTGTFKPSSQTVTIPLSYGAQYEGIRGFNLVGNPYPRKLSMSEIKIDGEPITIYYRLVEGTNGSEFVPCTSGDILPGEGFFIKATEAGQVLTIGGE